MKGYGLQVDQRDIEKLTPIELTPEQREQLKRELELAQQRNVDRPPVDKMVKRSPLEK